MTPQRTGVEVTSPEKGFRGGGMQKTSSSASSSASSSNPGVFLLLLPSWMEGWTTGEGEDDRETGLVLMLDMVVHRERATLGTGRGGMDGMWDGWNQSLSNRQTIRFVLYHEGRMNE